MCIFFFVVLIGCNGLNSKTVITPEIMAQAKSKIQIYLDKGDEVQNATVDSVFHTAPNTFVGIYSFYNSLVRKDIRVTARYIFTSGLEEIVDRKQLKIESRKEGEWVDTGLIK